MSLPIGFFAPLPLPMMIPFMGMQSAVMAEQFGTMFQYGKRRISAMSNDEFNALTPAKIQFDLTKQLQLMIPEMEAQIQSMRPLVSVIIREFASYIGDATRAILAGGEGGFQQTTGTTLAPTNVPSTGAAYIQGIDGKTYYYLDGVLISIDGVLVSAPSGTDVLPIIDTGTITSPTITSPTTTTPTTTIQRITVNGVSYNEGESQIRVNKLRNELDTTQEGIVTAACPSTGGSTWCQNMHASLQRTYQDLVSHQQSHFDKWGYWP